MAGIARRSAHVYAQAWLRAMQPVRSLLPGLIATVGARDIAKLAPQLRATASTRLRPVGAAWGGRLGGPFGRGGGRHGVGDGSGPGRAMESARPGPSSVRRTGCGAGAADRPGLRVPGAGPPG